MAISRLICVTVRKKTVGFISGEEMMNAMIALNGIPAERKERPIGIAAYVGRGETSPMHAAETIARYSFLLENCIFFEEKNRLTIALSRMLRRR
jgi:hypothetical protein